MRDGFVVGIDGWISCLRVKRRAIDYLEPALRLERLRGALVL